MLCKPFDISRAVFWALAPHIKTPTTLYNSEKPSQDPFLYRSWKERETPRKEEANMHVWTTLWKHVDILQSMQTCLFFLVFFLIHLVNGKRNPFQFVCVFSEIFAWRVQVGAQWRNLLFNLWVRQTLAKAWREQGGEGVTGVARLFKTRP